MLTKMKGTFIVLFFVVLFIWCEKNMKNCIEIPQTNLENKPKDPYNQKNSTATVNKKFKKTPNTILTNNIIRDIVCA